MARRKRWPVNFANRLETLARMARGTETEAGEQLAAALKQLLELGHRVNEVYKETYEQDTEVLE